MVAFVDCFLLCMSKSVLFLLSFLLVRWMNFVNVGEIKTKRSSLIGIFGQTKNGTKYFIEFYLSNGVDFYLQKREIFFYNLKPKNKIHTFTLIIVVVLTLALAIPSNYWNCANLNDFGLSIMIYQQIKTINIIEIKAIWFDFAGAVKFFSLPDADAAKQNFKTRPNKKRAQHGQNNAKNRTHNNSDENDEQSWADSQTTVRTMANHI